MPSKHYKPVVRAALLAALDVPSKQLRRAKGGYFAFGAPITKSGATTVQAFTRRAMNWLERDGLVAFDEPEYPSIVTLTDKGVAAAQQLKEGRA